MLAIRPRTSRPEVAPIRSVASRYRALLTNSTLAVSSAVVDWLFASLVPYVVC